MGSGRPSLILLESSIAAPDVSSALAPVAGSCEVVVQLLMFRAQRHFEAALESHVAGCAAGMTALCIVLASKTATAC